MDGSSALEFPCSNVPEDAATRSLLGLYEMRRHGGLCMQRVKAPSGHLTPSQLEALADIVDAFTPGYPLHVTTRQDVELHGVGIENVPAVQRALAEAGLTTVATCGDSVRNITCCPGSGLCPDTVDVYPLAQAILAEVETLPGIRSLPRKFKMSVSGCEKACGRPYINDLAFVVGPDGGLRAIGAGSLGVRPLAGIELYKDVSPVEAVALARAAITFFASVGDRKNRGRARLRHVRERMGEESFRRELDSYFTRERAGKQSRVPKLGSPQGGKAHVAKLHLPLGDAETLTLRAIARAARDAKATIRIGLEHELILYCDYPVAVTSELTQLLEGPRIVACPGRTWCRRGIVDSRAAAESIRQAARAAPQLSIAISGCPNNCSHAAVADIGLIGRMKSVDGTAKEHFRVLAEGGKGTTPAIGHEVHPAVAEAEIGEFVTKMLQ